MALSTEADPWRAAIAAVLPQANNGREAAHWEDGQAVGGLLTVLATSGRCWVYGGSGTREPKPEQRQGLLLSVSVQPERDVVELALQQSEEALRLRLTSLRLTFIPHRADSADSGFLLTGRPDGEYSDTWAERARPGLPKSVALVLGERQGLLIGAASGITIRHPLYSTQLRRALEGGIYRPHDAKRLQDETAIKQDLAERYAERRGKKSGPMDQGDVDFLAWAALEMGLQPTLELLREIHGSGSPTTLHPKLKAFYGSLVRTHLHPVPPPEVPEALRRVWHTLVDEVKGVGQESLTAEREALETRLNELTEAQSALARDRASFEDEKRVASAAGAERERLITSQSARITALEEDQRGLRTTNVGYELELGELRRDRQDHIRQIEEARQGLRETGGKLEEADRDRVALQGRIVDLERDCASAAAAMAALEGDVRDLRTRLAAATNAQIASQAERSILIQERDRLLDAARRREGEVEENIRQNATLAARVALLEPLANQVSNLRDSLAASLASLECAREERDRLQARVIEASMPPAGLGARRKRK